MLPECLAAGSPWRQREVWDNIKSFHDFMLTFVSYNLPSIESTRLKPTHMQFSIIQQHLGIAPSLLQAEISKFSRLLFVVDLTCVIWIHSYVPDWYAPFALVL